MSETRVQILDVAERLTQLNGFNGFSYLDLAEEVGIKNSSIHYHFKAKVDLASALVERTHDNLLAAFSEMELKTSSPEKRLKSLITYFQSYIKDEKYCLCGMMSAELQTVGPTVRKRLLAYFADFQAWLEKQFKAMGHADAKIKAIQFLSALEGCLLLARLESKPRIVGQTLGSMISP